MKLVSNSLYSDFAHIEDVQWGTMITLMPNPRKPKKWWPRVPTSGPIATSFQEFVSALQAYKDDYPELFDKKKDVTRFVEVPFMHIYS